MRPNYDILGVKIVTIKNVSKKQRSYIEDTDTCFSSKLLILYRRMQSKTLFLVIFDPRLLIVKSIFDCRCFHILLVHSISRAPLMS